jgi:hypothetical protein
MKSVMNKPHITRLFGFRGYAKKYFFDFNYWKVNEYYCKRFHDACRISRDIEDGVDIRRKYNGVAFLDVITSVTV